MIIVILTTVIESLAIAASKSVWTSGKLHARDASKFDHSWSKALSGRAWSLEMQIPFTVFSERRNNGMCPISSLRGTGNCFCPDGILRRNSVSGEVNSGAAKTWSLKIKVSRFRWGQSSRHGSSGTSGIPNLFLALSLVVKSDDPVWQKSHREKYKYFLLSQVSLGIFERDFN